ncbi:MAG: sensor histidine kinase [Elusimicrobia bacterium]|nr:sensor histidine kinase [Elusimicrobiota bacterium]
MGSAWQNFVAWWRGHLRVKLLTWFGLAVAVPVLVVASLLVAISEQALVQAIDRQQSAMARSIVERVEERLKGYRALLDAVAKQPDLKRWSLSQEEQWLRGLMDRQPAFQTVAFINPKGRETLRVERAGRRLRVRRRLVDRSTEDAVAQTVQRRTSYVGRPVFGRNGVPELLLAEPLGVSGGLERRQGALLVTVSLDPLSSLVAEAQVGPRGQAFILDGDGVLIAHPIPERVRARANFRGLPMVQEFIAAGRRFHSALREHRDEGGEPVVSLAMAVKSLPGIVVVQQPKAVVYEPLRAMRARFVGWTFLWLGFFVGAGWFLINRILRPVRELQRGVEQLKAGQWQVQLVVQTGDELETLARTFQQMAIALGELEELRRDLIAMIVHDLKSPLTVILASLDLLSAREGGAVTDTQQRFLSLARQSGQDLLDIIQNLLDVAKMEEGKLVLHREPCALAELIRSQVSRWTPVAQLEDKTIHTDLVEDVPPVRLDRPLIMRVISNLLANALRHTSRGYGVISVTLTAGESAVTVQVQDNGEGIPQEYQEKIFEKFVQAARKRARVRTGVGLGLTFCKMAVEAHGGRIGVESQPGHGSTFTWTLPREPQLTAKHKEPVVKSI